MHRLTTSERQLEQLVNSAQARHVRYFDREIPYHIIARIIQNRLLLLPDEKYRVRRLILGVIGRAHKVFPHVKLFIANFMSNHMHLMVQGEGTDISRFVGFISREISRRLGWLIDWSGPKWKRFIATALPTDEAALNCFKYILSQGVKDGMVPAPQDWPGLACARFIANGKPLVGRWLDATALGRARHKAEGRKRPTTVREVDHIQEYEVILSRLAQWEGLSEDEYRETIRGLIDEIVREAPEKPPIGLRKLFKMSRFERGNSYHAPWFEDRSRMVVWDDTNKPEVRTYLSDYWQHQIAYREASKRLLGGELEVPFPPGSFRPSFPEVGEHSATN